MSNPTRPQKLRVGEAENRCRLVVTRRLSLSKPSLSKPSLSKPEPVEAGARHFSFRLRCSFHPFTHFSSSSQTAVPSKKKKT
jgi:hypothetical protein